jgi:hypothetical protein
MTPGLQPDELVGRPRIIVVALALVLVSAATPAAIGSDVGPSHVHEAPLVDVEGGPGEEFGSAVAVEGDTVVVGSGTPSTGPPGEAQVFTRDKPGVWTETAELVPRSGNRSSAYGMDVALSGDTAIVGDPGAEPGGLRHAGAVHVFERGPDGSWDHQARLTAADGRAGDALGWSLALEGRRALAGAIGDTNANGHSAGSVYGFSADETGAWSQDAKILASSGSPGDNFGATVALDGSVGLASNSMTHGLGAGRVSVLEARTDGNWTEVDQLLDGGGDRLVSADVLAIDDRTVLVASPGAEGFHVFTETAPGDWSESRFVTSEAGFLLFGWSIALENGTAVVGTNPGGRIGTASNAPGSAFVYERNATGGWDSVERLRSLTPLPQERFGWSVGIDRGTIVVGEPHDANANGQRAGGAWVLRPVASP